MDLLIAFLVAMSVTMALIPPLMQLAVRYQILDAPNERKVHTSPIPRVGGIAMAMGVLLALGLSGSFAQPIPAFVAGIVVLLGFGVWDDRCTLPPATKLVGQVIAVLIVMLWGEVAVSSTTLADRHLLPHWLSLPLTFFFLIGVTNAINLADGLDGLAGGTTLLSLAALALLALTSGNAFVGSVAIAIMGAILGFLRFNTHPARVFMGDGGSQILGFSAGVLAVVLTQDDTTPLSSALPLLLLGIPIMDTLMVMTQRVLEGRSPFSADRNHIHHRLLARGFDHHEAVVAIYLLQAALFVAAWYLRYESDFTILVVFAVLCALTIGLLQLAARFDVRWRAQSSSERAHRSALSRAFEWMRLPQHVPMWALVTACALVSAFFVACAFLMRTPSLDVRLLAGVLACWIALVLVTRWADAETGLMSRAALYVAVVAAAYLNHEAGVSRLWPITQWLSYGVLVLCILLRFRLAADRRFRVTPLDVLVVLAAVIIPNLPGSIVNTEYVGESIAKLIALLYGLEALLGAGARWWRVPALAAFVFLAVCALHGGI